MQRLLLAAAGRRRRRRWNLDGCSDSSRGRGRRQPRSWRGCETGRRRFEHGDAGDRRRRSPISRSSLSPSLVFSPATWTARTRTAVHLRPGVGGDARWFGSVGRDDDGALAAGAHEEHDANVISHPRYSPSYDRDTGIVTIEVTSDDDDDGTDSAETSKKNTLSFQTVVGIEVHAQLMTATKLFSSAPTGHDNNLNSNPADRPNLDSIPEANKCVEPHDLGYPGTLPQLSSSAVRAAVLSAAALNCSLHETSRFERKHYAYPDLSLGYQVTQQRWPLATCGYLDCRYGFNPQQKKKRKKKRRKRGRRTGGESDDSSDEGGGDDGDFFRVGVERVQIEQDTGKTTSDRSSSSSSLVDFNRAGRALIEIVFRPDVRSPNEAASVVSTLRRLLRRVGTCDGRMEYGSLRCDLNVSVAPIVVGGSSPCGVVGRGRSSPVAAIGDATNGLGGDDGGHTDDPFAESLPPGAGQRVEVKNLNSVRQVIAATEYEAVRQAVAYCRGRPIPRHETRTFDVSTGRTVRMRRKEGAVDYRFLPEPDLPPLVLDEETLGGQSLSDLLDSMPELPERTTRRLVERYGLDEDVALVIASDAAAAPLFERAVEAALADLRRGGGGDDDDDGRDHRAGHHAGGANDGVVRGDVVGDVGGDVVDASAAVPGAVANWLCNDLFALVKESSSSSCATSSASGRQPVNDDEEVTKDDEGAAAPSASAHVVDDVTVHNSKVDGTRLGSLVAMVLNGTVSTRAAKQILAVMYREEGRLGPRAIAEERGWQLIRDPEELRRICEEVVSDEAHEEQLRQYSRGGKKVHKIEKFFIGKAMSACRGNADPSLLLDALRLVLQSRSGVR